MQHEGVSPHERAMFGESAAAVNSLASRASLVSLASLASLVNVGLRIATGASRDGITQPLPGADIQSIAGAGRYVQRMLCALDPRESRG